jgi:TIR domain
MADLFLSYAHQDTRRAKTLAKLLEDAGLTVWWDRRMVAGDKIHDVVDEEIEKAKAVIVLWSRFSVKSDWVLGEAQTAQESAKLVPIKIAACKLPVNYRGIHTPAVYKGKSELDELARMLSDKFRTALPLPRGATKEPSKVVVDLHGRPKPFEDDPEFIRDLARFADGVLSESAVKRKYRLAESVWDALASNDALFEKIKEEKLRRLRDGSSKREKAQQLVDPKITIEFTNESSVNFLMKLSVVSFSIWFINTIGAFLLHTHDYGGHHDGGHFDGDHFDGGDGGHH